MISDESGIKHFDRKFVASNLPSLLRCPKCKNDFTSTNGKAQEVRHRPFLLPCGHSLCEDCILKNRKNLNCAICFSPAPSTINAKDPNSQSGVSVRDFYELNYHALGELTSLFSFRRFTQDSVNKSMIFTADDDIIMEPKCSECGHNVSTLGDCSQCNACYCKRCFDTVHRHSRVLQAHQFQMQQQNVRKFNTKPIRVGNEIFEMPFKRVCTIHNAPQNVYCGTCRRTICEKCVEAHHARHKGICPLHKLNMRHIDQIPTSMGLIESSMANIKNSQLVVKNTKKILDDYAIETLTKISKHFNHLHGLLQVAELQVIEKLRESSLSPQIKLNEAMNNLNGYETVLKTLSELFESESNIGVPKNVWLKELLGLTTRHLDKIPANVQVTKLDKNPYIFEIASSSGQTMTAMLKKNFRCDFIDPQMKVLYQSVYEMNSPISSIAKEQRHDSPFFKSSSNSEKENDKQSQHNRLKKKSFRHSKSQLYYHGPSQPGQTPDPRPPTAQLKRNHNNQMKRVSKKNVGKRNSISICNTSSSSEEGRLPNNSNIRMEIDSMRTTFSEIDINIENNNKSNNGFWFKSDIMVKVRTINSPDEFFVQGIQAVQRIEREIGTFCQTSDCHQTKKIVVGKYYITYHSDVNRYHRAMVKEKLQEQDLYQVILPDIGMQVAIHAKNFRELPRKLAMIPFAAVQCKLKHLMPRNGGSDWDAEAIKFFKQLVQNNSVYVTMVVPTDRTNIYEVELMVPNYNTNISVRESFLYTGLARARYGNAYAADPVKPKQLVALGGQRLPMYQALFGDAFMAQILHLDSPHEFYVMRHDMESKRYELQTTLQRVMDNLQLGQLENIYLGRLHLACVLQVDHQWHRARIEQMLPEGFVVVRLVDIGTVQKVSWDHLFLLPSKFWHTEIAIKCCLTDVETLAEHGYLWTSDAIEAFTQLTSNPKLHMEVIGMREDFVHVALNVMRPSGEILSVGAQMVKQNHCKSTGDTSRLPRTSLVSPSSYLDDAMLKFIKQQTKKSLNLSLTADIYSQVNRNRKERVPIKILYVKQPDEFYVTLAQFIPAIAGLKKLVQEVAAEMHEKCLPRCEWNVDDMCYVHFQAHCDDEMMWHRGIVVKVIFSDSDLPKYRIRLRDLGQLASDIPASQMTSIDETHRLISDSALRCHLYGIHPKGGRWTSQGSDFFKDQLQAYHGLEVSSYGRDENSLAVVLWGIHTEIRGPFSPERVKYSNLNNMLVLSTFAFKDENKSSVRSDIGSNDEAESSCSIALLQSCKENPDGGIQSSKLVASKDSVNQSMISSSPTQDNDEMPPLTLLKDLNMSSTTTGEASAPLAWTMPRECKKNIFMALPTYVNYECQAFLTLANDKPFMEQMRIKLEKHFKPMMSLSGVHHFVVGQPVLVKYHLDNFLYRGIVKRLANLQGEYTVYFIDFGNDELVTSAEMLPYAPFPQLKAMCWLVDIHGAHTKSKKYTIVEMDTIHKQIVMKLCSVRVVEMQGPNGVPSCQIKVDNLDIGEMISKMGGSIPLENKLLESFKVFDELLHFGEPVEELQHDGNSTIKPPPPKKAFLKQTIFSDSEPEDFDVEEAALQISMQETSFGVCSNSKNHKDDDEDLETESDEDDVSIRLLNRRENEDNGDDLPTGLPFNNNQSDVLEPHSSAVLRQLRRRIELRRKDMMNNVDFSPMDTSTVFSFDAEICFQPQSLPIGVNQFLCTVDCIISATELQISPCLTEFTKFDISLFQETSAVIEKAPPLHPEVNTLCLAQYSKDEQWYRATITELHTATQRATVLYIDFHDTETVPYANLKVMPKQLFTFPLRSFRVKLHKVKPNKSFADKTVRQALKACLCSHAYVFAKVFYPSTYHDSIRKGQHRLLEVELYENKHKHKVLYQPLIANWMYV